MYKLALSEIFNCQLDREAYAFLVQYPNMVNWWINQTSTVTAEEVPAGSFNEFRNHFYKNWKKGWNGYNSQHAQTSSLVAYSVLKLSKQLQTKEELRYSFAVVSPRIVKIEDEKLVFPTKLSNKAHVQLIPKNPTQQALLEQVQNNHWQLGQSFLTAEWCAIPFTRFLDLTLEKDRYIQDLLK